MYALENIMLSIKNEVLDAVFVNKLYIKFDGKYLLEGNCRANLIFFFKKFLLQRKCAYLNVSVFYFYLISRILKFLQVKHWLDIVHSHLYTTMDTPNRTAREKKMLICKFRISTHTKLPLGILKPNFMNSY